MSMAAFTKDITDGLYQAGKEYIEDGYKCAPIQYMTAYAKDLGIHPDEQRLAKATAKLVDKYAIPEWAELKRKSAKEVAAANLILRDYMLDRPNKTVMSGSHADTMEKAFQVNPAELTVFPFFWDTLIVESILAIPLLDVLVADTVNVNSGTAVHAIMNETTLDRSIGITGEFASFQEVNVTSTESTVRLLKFGGQISVSDEAMRRQRIPVFQRGFARYGRQIGIDMTDLAIDILLNGDGTYGGATSAVPTVACQSAGNPVYKDYVKAHMTFQIGYEPTDYLMSRAGFTAMLNVPQFEDPLAGFKFQSAGVLPQAFGLMPHRWDSTKSSSWTAAGVLGDGTTMLAIQRGRLLSLYEEGGLSTESFRDARSQTTYIVSSWYLIFSILDRLAGVSLTGVA